MTIRVYLLIVYLAINVLPVYAIANPLKTDTPNTVFLYQGLRATLEENRGHSQNALDHYLEIAKQSQDPQVAQHCTLLAISTDQLARAQEAASLWAKLEPKQWDAQVIALIVMLDAGPDQALPYLKQALNLHPKQMIEQLSNIHHLLSEKAQHHFRQIAFKLAQQQNNDAAAQLIAAFSSAIQADSRNANRFVNAALAIQPDFTPAIILKTRLILAEQTSDTTAIRYLKKQIDANPINAELRLFYANILLEAQQNKMDQVALQELKALTQDPQYGGLAHVVRSEYYLDHQELEQATQDAKKALLFDNAKPIAEYLLGVIDEQNNHPGTAILWYSQITQGPYYMLALLRTLDLLKEQKSFDQALIMIEEANPETIEDQKQLLLKKVDILQASQRTEEAVTLAHHLLEQLPNDPHVLQSLRALNLPLQAQD